MSGRPTPEELAEYWGGTSLLVVLRQEGYRIVHEDDVPPECQCYTMHEDWNASCPLNSGG